MKLKTYPVIKSEIPCIHSRAGRSIQARAIKLIFGSILFFAGVIAGYGLFSLKEFKNFKTIPLAVMAKNSLSRAPFGYQALQKSHESGFQSDQGIYHLPSRLLKIEADIFFKQIQIALLRGISDDLGSVDSSIGQSVRHYLLSQKITPADLSFALKPFLAIDHYGRHESNFLIEAAVRLSEIAARGIVFPASGEEDGTLHNYADINFSKLVDQDNFSLNTSTEFDADDVVKIYASFDTFAYPETEVLVKWYRADEPELLLFNKYPIDPIKDHNFVWLQKSQGWDSGRYTVEIYSVRVEDNIKMIARGDYTIW